MTTSLLGNTEDNQLDPNKNYLEELVGEDKKFKSVDDLAKGKFMSDLHISILEKRLDESREMYKEAAEKAKAAEKIEDLLTRLESQANLSSREHTPNSNEDTKTALDPTQISSLIAQEVSKLDSQKKQDQNFNTVMEKVREKYGESYSRTLAEQAKEMDLSADEVDALARRNPKAFFRTFGLDEVRSMESFQTPPNSGRSSTFAPNVQKRTMSYYQNLKKAQPDLYLDPKIAKQMDKDALALGEAFFDV